MESQEEQKNGKKGLRSYQKHFQPVLPYEWQEMKRIFFCYPEKMIEKMSYDNIVKRLIIDLTDKFQDFRYHNSCKTQSCRVYSNIYLYVQRMMKNELNLKSNQTLIHQNIKNNLKCNDDQDLKINSGQALDQQQIQLFEFNQKKNQIPIEDFEHEQFDSQHIQNDEDKDSQIEFQRQKSQIDQNVLIQEIQINQQQIKPSKHSNSDDRFYSPQNTRYVKQYNDSTMKKNFNFKNHGNKVFKQNIGLSCSEKSFKLQPLMMKQQPLQIDQISNMQNNKTSLDILNNIKSTENWAKSKNMLQQRFLGKRLAEQTSAQLLQELAIEAGTSFDQIVYSRKQIKLKSQELINLKKDLQVQVNNFCKILQQTEE